MDKKLNHLSRMMNKADSMVKKGMIITAQLVLSPKAMIKGKKGVKQHIKQTKELLIAISEGRI